MSTARDFPLGAVLTVTTYRFLAADFQLVYDILNHLTGDDLMTYQIPRAMQTASPYVLAEHPQLRGVEPPQDVVPGELFLWLGQVVQTYGVQLPVSALPPGVWVSRNPLEELAALRKENGT